MPRGENPNSRANLTHRFTEQTARQAQKKSAATRKYNGRFREAAKEALTDDALSTMVQAMIHRAEQGNIAAFKTLFDIMGEANQAEPEAEVRLAFLAPQDEPEQPPEDIPEE